jgi:hypothetical protein
MVLNVGLSIALVWPLGIAGVFWATLASFAVTTPWYVVEVCHQLGVSPRLAVRRAIAPVAIPMVAEAIVLGAVAALIGPSSARLVVGAVVGGGVFIAAASRTSFRHGELGELWRALRGRASR